MTEKPDIQIVQPKHKYYTVLICITIALAAFIAYEQLRYCDFVFDDTVYIVRNQYVAAGLTFNSVIWAFTHYVSYWHPLTWLSYMLSNDIFGAGPGWHHMTNLLLHIINALLLFGLLKRMTGALWRSAFVAAVFALHPINVEAVAWISARKDVLSTLFFMLTIALYLQYVRRHAVIPYLLALVTFAFGLMAKPMLITLPFVLLLLDFWPLDRFQLGLLPGRTGANLPESEEPCSKYLLALQLFKEKIPFFGLSAVSICFSFYSALRLGIVLSAESVPLKLRIANALVSYLKYIDKIIRPQNLAVFYPFPADIPLWQTIAALLALICIFILTVRLWKKAPYFLTGWLWYFVTVFTVIGLVQAGTWPAMADRFVYIPSIGIFIIFTWGIAGLLPKGRFINIVLKVSAVLLLAVLLLCTRTQLQYWKNDITLFGRAVKVTRNNYFSLYNLGNALRQENRTAEAVSCYRQVLQIKPNHLKAHINLGGILSQQGEFDEAIGFFQQALQLDPDNPGIHFNLADALAGNGKFNEAIAHYRQAIKLAPNYLGPLNALANMLATNPNPDVRDADEAIVLAERAAELTDYNNATILDTLAAAYASAGRFSRAIETAEKALELAESSKNEKLTVKIQNRLLLYRADKPYLEPLPEAVP